VEFGPGQGTAHRRRLAVALAFALVGLAALAYAFAALQDFSLGGSQSLDPSRRGFAAAGAFAAVLCVVALWRLREVARGRAGWGDAGLCFAFAVLALLVLLAVATASRLGG
jgi:hypothetical protein